MVDVSIIIVNYNTYNVTKECIDSIFQNTHAIKYEIILVDNNSQDESFALFSKDKRIVYLYQDKNWGFGKANNIGYNHSKGKYIFLLNSDTLLKSNAVKEFYDYMEGVSKEYACVGTYLQDLNGDYIHSYGKFPSIWKIGLGYFSIIGDIYLSLKRKTIVKKTPLNLEVDYITGADLFIRKEVSDKLGLFDSDFFMYFEETEMQFRYRKHGYKSILYSQPKIIHLENYSMNNAYKKKTLKKKSILLLSYFTYLKKCNTIYKYYVYRIIFSLIVPFYIFHPSYSFKDKFEYIKKAYIL